MDATPTRAAKSKPAGRTLAILTVLAAIYTLVQTVRIYPMLPDRIPMSYDLYGAPTAWGIRVSIFLFPAAQWVLIGFTLLWATRPRAMGGTRRGISPELQKQLVDNTVRMIWSIAFFLSLMLLAASVMVARSSMDRQLMVPTLGLFTLTLWFVTFLIFFIIRHLRLLSQRAREKTQPPPNP